MTPWAVILAAGSGSRLAAAGLTTAKQYIPFGGRPLFWHGARTFARVPAMAGLVFVFPEAELASSRDMVASLTDAEDLGLPWTAVAGGERRQDSVAAGLAALPKGCDAVLVHDAARPFASAELVQALLDALESGRKTGHVAAVPGIPVTDTIKSVAPGQGLPVVTGTPDRAGLMAVQTPQAFSLDILRRAHQAAAQGGWDVTDDASMVERLGRPVAVVPGEPGNVKITTPEDLAMLHAPAAPQPRTGWGYDVHRFGPGRPMRLGGVPIPGAPEVIAHSDGDVLLHALTDAVLGLFGGGDIGRLFPDTDAANEGLESGVFLDTALNLAAKAGVRVVHADVTLVAQAPRLAPWMDQIRDNLVRLLALAPQAVNVKATTEEGLGFTGRKEGIKAVACVTALATPGEPS